MIDLKISPTRFNPIYVDRLFANDNRYQIVFGGASSGKSVALAQRAVLDVLGGKRNYLVVRNVARTLRQSCFTEIIKVIKEFKLSPYFSINKGDMVVTCKLNARQILSAGLDDTEKIKSITPQSGALTDIWCEEATECDKSAIKQLDKRLRGVSSATKRLTLSFNPILNTHWIVSEYFDIWRDDRKYVEKDNVSILKTTYLDNRFLASDDIKSLEGETDPYYRNVYTLGNWGVLGDTIFRNWRVEEFEADNFSDYRHGVDWGFGSDPFAYVKVHYDKASERVYICDELTGKGLSNVESAKLIKPLVGNDLVVCDSAEPKSVTEYQTLGISATGARKGPGSLAFGLKFLQRHLIIVHPRCQLIKNELASYKYRVDANGNSLPVPVDANNHCIDALRYATEDAYLAPSHPKPAPEYSPRSRTKASYEEQAREIGSFGEEFIYW